MGIGHQHGIENIGFTQSQSFGLLGRLPGDYMRKENAERSRNRASSRDILPSGWVQLNIESFLD
jgi:hypothetical protein